MRQRRLWVIMVLALGSGGFAAFFALRYLRQQTPRFIASETPRASVAIAARDMNLGTILGPEDVKLIDWPEEAVPPGYVSSAEAIVGRGLIAPVRANEVLLETKLATKDAGGGLAISIPEGMRAVSVRVDEVIGVAGFVLPATRVDVMVTLPPRPPRSETMTQVFLQNIQALAAGQLVQQDAEGKPVIVAVITLLVSPEQGELLVLGANEGKIQLALRNTLDLDDIETRGAQVSDLLRRIPRAPRPNNTARVVARGDTSTVVEAYKGGVRTLIKF
jgi:pilus assembly protein CpaB